MKPPFGQSVDRIRDLLKAAERGRDEVSLTGIGVDIEQACERLPYLRFDTVDFASDEPRAVVVADIEWLGRKDAVATIATLDTYIFWLIGHFTEDTITVTRLIGETDINYDVVMGDEDHVEFVRLRIFGDATIATIRRYRELQRGGDAPHS